MKQSKICQNPKKINYDFVQPSQKPPFNSSTWSHISIYCLGLPMDVNPIFNLLIWLFWRVMLHSVLRGVANFVCLRCLNYYLARKPKQRPERCQHILELRGPAQWLSSADSSPWHFCIFFLLGNPERAIQRKHPASGGSNSYNSRNKPCLCFQSVPRSVSGGQQWYQLAPRPNDKLTR